MVSSSMRIFIIPFGVSRILTTDGGGVMHGTILWEKLEGQYAPQFNKQSDHQRSPSRRRWQPLGRVLLRGVRPSCCNPEKSVYRVG